MVAALKGDSDSKRLGLIGVLALASSFAPISLDFYVPSLVNTAAAFDHEVEALQITLYSFLLGFGLSPFLWGKLSDRYGYRSIFLLGVGSYVLASLGCLYSESIVELTAFHFLQGVCAAAGLVLARALLRDIYGAEGAVRAIAVMYLFIVIAPVLAPLIGGILADRFGWSVTFKMMIFLGCLCWISLYLYVPELGVAKRTRQADSRGALLALVQNRTFMGNALANLFCLASMVLFITNYAPITERELGLNATQNGYLLALFNSLIATGVGIARCSISSCGSGKTMLVGTAIAVIGWAGLALPTLWGVVVPACLMVALTVACIGNGIIIALAPGQAMAPLEHNTGLASAMYGFFQFAGSAVVGLCVGLFTELSLAVIALAMTSCAILSWLSYLLLAVKFNPRPSTVSS